MFYSETLLQKTGPLARVWLSANLERKLSKTHILQSNVKDSVDAIITPNQAPMALRLSGQLLLGVVRIYSRKARYLLDDCNEALIKIKMAFRLSGNNDIPAGLHMPSRDALMLPDVLTEGDNLEMPPMPDASILFSQLEDENMSRKRRAGSRDINLQEDFNTSQFLQGSVENRNYEEELALEPMDDLDLGLVFEIGDDFLPSKGDESIEIGRDAPAARAVEEDLLSEMDVQLPSKEADLGGDNEPSITFNFGNDDDELRLQDDDGDVEMFNIGEQTDMSALPPATVLGRERISESPLSDVDETIIAEHQHALDASIYEQVEESEQSIYRRPAQRAKKVLKVDNETTLGIKVIKDQQKNHDNILQPLSFLPRDPELLALMELQKNGGFVSNIMGDGRSADWAPELRGLLSLDSVRRTGDLKRKRDSGVADMGSDQEGARKSPRLELGEQEDELPIIGDAGLGQEETIIPADNTVMEVPGEEEFMQMQDDDRVSAAPSPGAAFDETTAPLIHPADNGPISLGTKHAVHLLRDQFGAEAANSPNKRKQASVLFQDLLPEATTTRADATKMFFEVLVLATKDAVKIEQQEGLLGGPIRVRGKRGLWGDWAEREAGGEIAEEANVPLEASASVAVAA
ncbi:Cohesin subunit rad21 [Phlyctema vagabunda]|uniref:Cohesin subunit rad21 n=1 Tax=Phlyctema vagabunda TaxID=108571 RepID=A0ABR4P7B3_9HELO